MNRQLALEFTRITEAASIATLPYIGFGDKNKADDAAVSAMRSTLNSIDFSGKIVIGEGTIDEAPMLYIGEEVGKGGEELDIAVDPIDGTRMVALGQENAVAVMVLAKKGTLLNAPDMYMEKIMVSKNGVGSVDLKNSIEDNIRSLAKKLNKDISDLTIMTLAKPRHEKTIKLINKMGAKVIAIPDGDVAGSVLVGMPNSDVDMFYGIGGAPEGVISAAILRSLEGDMQARFVTRSDCKGKTVENDIHSKRECEELEACNINIETIFKLEQLSSDDNLIVTMTGITNSILLDGVTQNNEYVTTHTLLIRGKTKTIRKIESIHNLYTKDNNLIKLMGEKYSKFQK